MWGFPVLSLARAACVCSVPIKFVLTHMDAIDPILRNEPWRLLEENEAVNTLKDELSGMIAPGSLYATKLYNHEQRRSRYVELPLLRVLDDVVHAVSFHNSAGLSLCIHTELIVLFCRSVFVCGAIQAEEWADKQLLVCSLVCFFGVSIADPVFVLFLFLL
jgi:hypothetical protein